MQCLAFTLAFFVYFSIAGTLESRINRTCIACYKIPSFIINVSSCPQVCRFLVTFIIIILQCLFDIKVAHNLNMCSVSAHLGCGSLYRLAAAFLAAALTLSMNCLAAYSPIYCLSSGSIYKAQVELFIVPFLIIVPISLP